MKKWINQACKTTWKTNTSLYIVPALYMSPAELSSCHNGFRSTWMTTKIKGVATDLFCTGVFDHSGCIFLN